MSGPLVSVLVPLYNHEKYIETCLDSIGAEGYPDLELILLDDGSSDRSFALASAWIEAHRERFVRVQVRTQPNAGICRTANRLLQEARGPYIAFVASDDALKPGGLRARVDHLERHPALLAVIGDAEAIDGEGRTLAASTIQDIHRGSRRTLARPGRITRELILRWSIPGPVMLARKTAWDPVLGAGSYDETLALEDRDFYLRLLALGALGFLDLSVARYRIHSLNSCRRPSGDPDLASLQNLIAADIKKSSTINLHRFKGLDRFLLALVIANDRYRQPRKRLRYAATRNLMKLFRFMNRAGLLGG